MFENLSFLRKTLQRIAPHQCPFCEAQSHRSYFCQRCEQAVKQNQQCCAVCAIPLTDAHARCCAHCLKSPPPFNQSFAPFIYDTALAPVLSHFKDRGKLACGAQLSDMFVQKLFASETTMPDLIVPVPSHWQTYLKRGFNPAEEIASRIAKAVGVPCSKMLIKKRATKKQKSMTKKARQHNLVGAFALKAARQGGANIALLDDVVTTGATADACARLLRSSGVSTIQIWALARTPDPKAQA